MITKIQLQKDAAVLAVDGKKVGSLERVVVNPETKVITDIVVRTGGLLGHDEKIVSVDLIDATLVGVHLQRFARVVPDKHA